MSVITMTQIFFYHNYWQHHSRTQVTEKKTFTIAEVANQNKHEAKDSAVVDLFQDSDITLLLTSFRHKT